MARQAQLEGASTLPLTPFDQVQGERWDLLPFMVSLSNHLSGDLKERAETNMLAYDEKVTIKYRDGGVVGGCRMIGWVDGDAGSRRWHGELVPIAGQPWEFAVASIEGVGLQVECADGATARILPPTVTDALSSGVRCTFEGVWPPPRPVG